MGLQPWLYSQYHWSRNWLISSPVFPETMYSVWIPYPLLGQWGSLSRHHPLVEVEDSAGCPWWDLQDNLHPREGDSSSAWRFTTSVSDGTGAGFNSAFNIYMGQDHGDMPASMKALITCFYEKVSSTWYQLPDFGDGDVGPVVDDSKSKFTCLQPWMALHGWPSPKLPWWSPEEAPGCPWLRGNEGSRFVRLDGIVLLHRQKEQ